MRKTNEKILLIGENMEILSMTGRILEKKGFSILKAVGAGQAHVQMERWNPRLVIMDCELPDGDGLQACRMLRRRKLPVKIILTSNNPCYEVEAFHAGADDFIKKPYNMDVLEARIERLCAETCPAGTECCKTEPQDTL